MQTVLRSGCSELNLNTSAFAAESSHSNRSSWNELLAEIPKHEPSEGEYTSVV